MFSSLTEIKKLENCSPEILQFGPLDILESQEKLLVVLQWLQVNYGLQKQENQNDNKQKQNEYQEILEMQKFNQQLEQELNKDSEKKQNISNNYQKSLPNSIKKPPLPSQQFQSVNNQNSLNFNSQNQENGNIYSNQTTVVKDKSHKNNDEEDFQFQVDNTNEIVQNYNNNTQEEDDDKLFYVQQDLNSEQQYQQNLQQQFQQNEGFQSAYRENQENKNNYQNNQDQLYQQQEEDRIKLYQQTKQNSDYKIIKPQMRNPFESEQQQQQQQEEEVEEYFEDVQKENPQQKYEQQENIQQQNNIYNQQQQQLQQKNTQKSQIKPVTEVSFEHTQQQQQNFQYNCQSVKNQNSSPKQDFNQEQNMIYRTHTEGGLIPFSKQINESFQIKQQQKNDQMQNDQLEKTQQSYISNYSQIRPQQNQIFNNNNNISQSYQPSNFQQSFLESSSNFYGESNKFNNLLQNSKSSLQLSQKKLQTSEQGFQSVVGQEDSYKSNQQQQNNFSIVNNNSQNYFTANSQSTNNLGSDRNQMENNQQNQFQRKLSVKKEMLQQELGQLDNLLKEEEQQLSSFVKQQKIQQNNFQAVMLKQQNQQNLQQEKIFVKKPSMKSVHSNSQKKIVNNHTKQSRNASFLSNGSVRDTSRLHQQNDEELDIDQTKNDKIKVINQKGSSLQNTMKKQKNIQNVLQVSSQRKNQILKWFIEINLVKDNIPNLEEKLHKICKNGVIFSDLINRLNGKHDIIKGINRQAKNNSQIKSNFLRILNYLKQFDKFNPRFLHQVDLFTIDNNSSGNSTSIENNNQIYENAFWGLLDDIYHWNQNKLSPYDSRYQKNGQNQHNNSVQKQRKSSQISNINIVNNDNNSSNIHDNSIDDINTILVNKNIKEQSGDMQSLISDEINNENNNNKNYDQLQEQQFSDNQFMQHQQQVKQISHNFKQKQNDINNYNYNSRQNSQQQQDINSSQIYYTNQQPKNYYSARKKNSFKEYQGQYSSKKSKQNIKNEVQGSFQQGAGTPRNNFRNQNNSNYNSTQNSNSKKLKSQQVMESPCNISKYTYQQNSYFQSPQNISKNGSFCNSGFKAPKIQLNIERQVCVWLKTLGFGSIFINYKKQLFEDPLRNGTLLVQVINKIQTLGEQKQNQILIDSYIQHPRNINECRTNLQICMQFLQNNTQYNLPYFILHKQEEIIRGEHDAVWGLFYHLQNAVNDINSNQNNNNNNYNDNQQSIIYSQDNKINNSASKMTNQNQILSQQEFQNPIQQEILLPYSSKQLQLLEQVTLQWVQQISSKCDKINNTNTYFDLEQKMRNGVLICFLVSYVEYGNFEDVTPVRLNPQNESNCLANLRKGLQVLRKKNQKEIGQKFLWKEKHIFQGNKFAILGLLEDLRKYQNKVNPQNQHLYIQEGEPYLEEWDQEIENYNEKQQNQDNSRNNNLITENNNIQDVSIAQQIVQQQKNQNSKNNLTDTQQVQDPYSIVKFSDTLEPFKVQNSEGTENLNNLFTSINNENNNSNNIHNKFQQQNQLLNNSNNINNNNNNRQLFQPLQKNQKIDDENNNNKQQFQLKSYPYNSNNQINVLQEKNLNNDNQGQNNQVSFNPQAQILSKKQQNVSDQYQIPQSYTVTPLHQWLIDIGIKRVNQINFQQKKVEAFKSGILLCEILEILERKTIPGIIQKPKTMASCLVNIRKAYQILKVKKLFDPQLLYDETQIYQGDSQFIQQFLAEIKKIYKNQTKQIQKLRNSSQGLNISNSINGLSHNNNIQNNSFRTNSSQNFQQKPIVQNQNLIKQQNNNSRYNELIQQKQNNNKQQQQVTNYLNGGILKNMFNNNNQINSSHLNLNYSNINYSNSASKFDKQFLENIKTNVQDTSNNYLVQNNNIQQQQKVNQFNFFSKQSQNFY